jgi:hypothetical protein
MSFIGSFPDEKLLKIVKAAYYGLEHFTKMQKSTVDFIQQDRNPQVANFQEACLRIHDLGNLGEKEELKTFIDLPFKENI